MNVNWNLQLEKQHDNNALPKDIKYDDEKKSINVFQIG